MTRKRYVGQVGNLRPIANRPALDAQLHRLAFKLMQPVGREDRMWTMRFLLAVGLISTALYGDDLSLQLDGGTILIRAEFIQKAYGSDSPRLTLKIRNRTSSAWRTLKLQLDIGGLCKGEPRQWTLPVTTSLGWAEDFQVVKEYSDLVIPLIGKVDGCTTEIIKAKLLFAENSTTRIDGVSGERLDLEKQLQEIKAKREANEAAQAEAERSAAELKAKKDAVDAARRKQQQAEANARSAKIKAEEEAKAAAERRKARAACTVIYRNTVDKKRSDLTVREEQQVGACQALGLYPSP